MFGSLRCAGNISKFDRGRLEFIVNKQKLTKKKKKKKTKTKTKQKRKKEKKETKEEEGQIYS